MAMGGQSVTEGGVLVNREELVKGLTALKKLGKARGKTEAYVSFSGGALKVQSRMLSYGVTGSGSFLCSVAVNAVQLTWVAQALPKTTNVTIQTDGDDLYFDTPSISCRRIDTVPPL